MIPHRPLLVALAVLALVVAAAVIALLANSRRRAVWRRFARRHGLRFLENSGPPAVAGIIRNRLVTLTVPASGSDGEELGVQEVRLEVSLQGTLPRGFEIVEGGPVIGEARRAFGEQVVELEDPEFSRRLIAKGHNHTEVRDYLSADRRRTLLRLLEDAQAGWSLLMDERRIAFEKRSLAGGEQELEQRLGRLLEAAPALDSPRADDAPAGTGMESNEGKESVRYE